MSSQDPNKWMCIRDEKLSGWLLNHPLAIEFIKQLHHVVGVWDDLIDKDKPINDNDVNAAFIACLIQIPNNEFFLKNIGHLTPVMLSALNAWNDSNVLCKNEKEVIRRAAFFLKMRTIDVLKACAFLVGGYDHMKKVSPDIEEFYAYEAFENSEFKEAT